jgi:glycosyltransferase involved in cell wall biosynthesis
MSPELRRKLEGLVPWIDPGQGPLVRSGEVSAATILPDAEDAVVHLGSYAHERWSIQREVLAVTDRELSLVEALATGLGGRPVVCWHPQFWRRLPEDQKRGSRAILVLHHHSVEAFDDPQVVAAICPNGWIRDELARRQPGKVVRLVRCGGAEDAVAHIRPRQGDAAQIRLVMCGNAMAPIASRPGDVRSPSRKGAELIVPIARRLDPSRHAWLFLGVGWEPYAHWLEERGWSVIAPGPLESPGHYAFFGEGDVFLMLSRLEGVPLTLLEAMGVGIWPICTPTGLVPELLTPGENGDLMPSYDGENTEAVADAVARVVLALSRSDLIRARDRVRRSVAHHTWANFRIDVETAVHDVFGSS